MPIRRSVLTRCCWWEPTSFFEKAKPVGTLRPTTPSPPPSSSQSQRLLRQLRTVSVRNLAVSHDNDDGRPCLPPSTYVQILARQPPSSSSATTTTRPPFRVYYTSEVAPYTHNPIWLVLDLEPLENDDMNNGDEGEYEEWEQEGGEEGSIEPSLSGEEICIRVFLATPTDDDNVGEINRSSDLITTITTKQRGRRRRAAPHLGRLQRGHHPSITPSPPLATFLFHLPRLWCLPPTVKLSQLHLPAFPATCLLATGEGGTGLLVEEGVGEALGLELNGGRRGDAPHLLDEQYVEELEEYQRRPPFASFSSLSSKTPNGAMRKLTLASPSSSSSCSSSQKREEESITNYRAEQAKLQAMLQIKRLELAREERALAEEEEGLMEEGRVLHALMKRHASLVIEAAKIEKETMDVEEVLIQKEFVVALRQRKLVEELQRIYPIERRSGEQEYRIRGLELPADTVNTTRDDDLIASALGYVCHVLVMLSKYLEVPLRYALECRSSRSLIQDATVAYAVFPLYKRGVERERFEWAVYLLKKNIQQLLCARGVSRMLLPGEREASGGGGGGGGSGGLFREPPYCSHILQNLQALFIHELASSSTTL